MAQPGLTPSFPRLRKPCPVFATTKQTKIAIKIYLGIAEVVESVGILKEIDATANVTSLSIVFTQLIV
jgi:hypothetical protein